MNYHFDQQSETRKEILMCLKQSGSETISSLRSKLQISSEAIRLQLLQLERDGLIKREAQRYSKGGRPALEISLTPKGESIFPKQYHALTVEVIDTVDSQLGKEAVKKVLSAMVDARVDEWESRLNGLYMEEKVAALKDFYSINDEFMDVEYHRDTETILLIERNCPFYDVALQRPVLCSVTLNTLTRLLGYRVVREKRFQNGDGCCVFRAQMDQPMDVPPFLLEDE